MTKAIPAGWLDYKNIGRQISGTRFIPFKTPLRKDACQNLNAKLCFTTRDLKDSCSSLGLIINLTFKTGRGYYDYTDISGAGIQYEHLPIPGKVIPMHKYVYNFFQVVEKFLKENTTNDKLIGVHCTHGLNRTGYFICRYMIDRLNVPPDQAIIEFNSARGHEQNRENYVEALRCDHLRDSYRDWVNQQIKTNVDIVPVTPETSKRKFRYDEDGSQWLAEPDLQQVSRKRKSIEVVDDTEKGNYKRVKYSSNSHLPTASNQYESKGDSTSIGKSYYQQYYRGEVQHQYSMDYYRKQKRDVKSPREKPGIKKILNKMKFKISSKKKAK